MTPLSEKSEKNNVQFFHCSAVKPANPDTILEGSRPISGGQTMILLSMIFKRFQISITCFAEPRRRLCIGSMVNILAASK